MDTLAGGFKPHLKSSKEKKMAAVHFATIPCKPYAALKVQGKPYFAIFVSVLTTLCTQGLKILELSCTFL